MARVWYAIFVKVVGIQETIIVCMLRLWATTPTDTAQQHKRASAQEEYDKPTPARCNCILRLPRREKLLAVARQGARPGVGRGAQHHVRGRDAEII
eukprot:CAMPEP_0179119178 /NCGR_PEP_ID=MMETSP0796-20121207/56092_1 /TAXON_ID=73915 /ORGANISM="Pyrodinium bahamense, Strain pbaha01" /LENGTH=95 /DNA_ID=CAMNT_0020817673 /DNA_START=117 /DNA_END=404 /DNA_ORIENTATION=+